MTACLAALASPASAAPAEQAPAEGALPRVRRVLELYQSDIQTPANVVFHAELRNALPPEREVDLFAENVDLARAGDDGYRRALRGWLTTKYASAPPDVIVAVGEGPIHFLLDQDPPLWPVVPVVFGMVEDDSPLLGHLPANFTGVFDDFPVGATIELAERLLPGTRRVVLVGGASDADRTFADAMRRDVAQFRGRLEVVDLVGLPTEELIARLRAQPPGTISIGLTYYVDGAGRRWNGPQIVPLLSAPGLPPVFVISAATVGAGTVGGVTVDFGATGRRVAALVKRLLAGEDPAALPPELGGPYRVVLDGRVLERLGVPEARIPPGAEVRFREPTPWRLFRWEIAGGVAALLVQAGLIVGLLVAWRGRLAAERRARENLAVVAHMNRVGAIGELAGSFAHELNSPLGAVLNNAQAARRFLAMGPEHGEDVTACLDDIVGDTRRAGEVVRRMRGVLRREDVRQVPVDVAAVIRDAVRLVEAEARDCQVTLTTSVEPVLPPLSGDDVQLVQVVLNLVMNAIDALRGAPEERRWIAVRAAALRAGVEISVVDGGPGIPPAQLEKVFEPFMTTKAGGLGLGLAITRSIVEAHGGAIRAAHVPEGGASFHVYLPADHDRARRRAEKVAG